MHRIRSRRVLDGLSCVALVVAATSPSCAPRQYGTEPASAQGSVTTTAAAVPPGAMLEPAIEVVTQLAPSTTWALGLDQSFVYYGDARTNTLRMVPKVGGASVRLAGHAPWAIAVVPPSVIWIGSPGDVVLRTVPPPPPAGAPADVLHASPGLLTAIAASGRDVYVAEVEGTRGAVLHITADGTTRIASLDAQPRALGLDGAFVYVQTPEAILRIPREGGRVDRVAVGVAASRLAVDDQFVYTTVRDGPSRAVARAPKSGGELVVVERGVRDAPIAAFGPDVFYFDLDQPTLRRVAKAGGASTIVARSPALSRITALAVDESGIFVGTEGEQGAVLAMPLPQTAPAAPLPLPPVPLPSGQPPIRAQ